jgi:hypothetical protein
MTLDKSLLLKYAWTSHMSLTDQDGSLTVRGVATLLQNIITGKNIPSNSATSGDLGQASPQ